MFYLLGENSEKPHEGGGGWHPLRARTVSCDMSFPVKLRLRLFLTGSKPSHFSHL